MNFAAVLRLSTATALLLLGPSLALAQQQQRPGPTPAARPTPAADAKFDFTPKVGELVSDGYPAIVVFFQDGAYPMQLNKPEGWKVAGSAAQMTFENPAFPGAYITLRSSSLPPPPKFDESWIEQTKPLILASAPKDANKPKILSATPDGFNIAGWKSMEFKQEYESTGRRLNQDWLFLLLNDGRFLEVITSAREENFPAVRSATLQIMAGFSRVPPKP